MALESFGVSRLHQAVFQRVHRVGEESPDETAIQIGGEQYWLYAAIDIDSSFLLGVRVSRWRGTRPASAFLSELKKGTTSPRRNFWCMAWAT